MNIIMEQGLFSLESLHPSSENIEGFYKADKFSNAIDFGVSLFVFRDLDTFF